MWHGWPMAVPMIRTFSPFNGEKVFLCPEPDVATILLPSTGHSVAPSSRGDSASDSVVRFATDADVSDDLLTSRRHVWDFAASASIRTGVKSCCWRRT
jgi:hypothetical protein